MNSSPPRSFIHTVILSCLCFLFVCSHSHAQDKNTVDTISLLIKQHRDHVMQCDALYQLGTYYWNIGQVENAYFTMNQCKMIAEKHDYDKGVYDANSIIGAIYLKQNDIGKVRAITRESLQLAAKNKSEYGFNKANYLLVIMYYQHNKLDSVISISKAVLELPHITYDSVTLPKFSTMLANAYLNKGDFYHANYYYLQALAIAEKTHNEPLQGVCLGNLALINDELKNYREGLYFQNKALALHLKNNQAQQIASSYLSMGNCYRHLLLPDSAIYYYRQALTWLTRFDARKDLAIVTTNLGAAFVDLNKLDSGLVYLQSAKKEFIAIEDTLNIANKALTLGSVWRQLGISQTDRSYLQMALTELHLCQNIAETKNIQDLKMKVYYELCLVNDALGNESEAFTYLKRYNIINDSIRSQAYTQQIAEMQTKYEAEKKEMEIIKLNAEKLLGNEKIARQKILNFSLLAMAGLILVSGSVVFRNVQKKRVAEKQVAILERQNAIENMRTKIASDVHDEMGANLTRLGLNAQQLLHSTAVPEAEKQLAEKMSLQSKEIIVGMREIIWASNPANDNLRSMLGFMRQYIDRFFDGTTIRPVVNFPHNVGEITLHPEVKRNLFLILKESLNNAVKYSDSNRIDINFQNENENFQLTVKDYGTGLKEEASNDFSSGMRNMQMRAEQIQSLFKLVSIPGQGVQISIEGKLY